MRLVDIKNELELGLQGVKDSPGHTNVNLEIGKPGQSYGYTPGEIAHVLNHLGKVPPFQDTAKAIEQLDIYRMTPLDSHAIIGEATSMQRFIELFRALCTDAQRLLTTIRTLTPAETPEMLSISLPEMSSLDQLGENVSKLNQTFNVTANIFYGEGVQFKYLEHGSNWITIAADSVKVFNLLVAIVSAAVAFARKKAQIGQSLLVLNEVNAPFQPVEAAINKIAERLADDIVADFDSEEPTPEGKLQKRGAALKAIKQLGELYLQGCEVRGALPAKGAKSDIPPESTFKELAAAGKEVAGLLTEGEKEHRDEKDKPTESAPTSDQSSGDGGAEGGSNA